jgi:hypothetical protein
MISKDILEKVFHIQNEQQIFVNIFDNICFLNQVIMGIYKIVTLMLLLK